MSTVVLCDHVWVDADGTEHQCALDEGHPEPHDRDNCHG